MSKKSKSVDFTAYSEEKLGSGKDEALANAKAFKGPSHKERQEQMKTSKKAIQASLHRKEERASWKKKAGGLVALFFLCGAGAFQFLSAIYGFVRGNGIENVDIKDTAKVKAVLFSGEPWFVYCVNNETEFQRLPKVLEEGGLLLWSSYGMRTAILHCWEPTESGRSVAERFDLNRKPPLSFVVANGNKPKLLQLSGVSRPEDLEKRVKPAVQTAGVSKIDTLKKWPSICTSRRTCIVIGHKNQAQRDYAQGLFPKALLERYRAARVVTLDTAFWQLKLGDAIMKTRNTKKGKSAEVVCLSRDEGKKGKGNATHSGMFLQELEAGAVDSFLEACQNREGVVQIEVPPKINARPSKPKKVRAPPAPRPRPPPPPPPKKKAKVDSVGSRESLENEEPLFEAVEEEEEEQQTEDGGDEDEGEDVDADSSEEESDDDSVEL